MILICGIRGRDRRAPLPAAGRGPAAATTQRRPPAVRKGAFHRTAGHPFWHRAAGSCFPQPATGLCRQRLPRPRQRPPQAPQAGTPPFSPRHPPATLAPPPPSCAGTFGGIPPRGGSTPARPPRRHGRGRGRSASQGANPPTHPPTKPPPVRPFERPVGRRAARPSRPHGGPGGLSAARSSSEAALG